MTHLKIKVCGITDICQVNELAAMGADFAGFIFYKNSPRYVGEKIKAETLKAVHSIRKVGVFVNEPINNILEKATKYGLDCIQLHGNESPDFCYQLKKQIPVIKVFPVKDDTDFHLIDNYINAADYFLFDTKTDEFGGSGKKFNWAILQTKNIAHPFLLSGGITQDDVSLIKSMSTLSSLYGVDINSKFEVSPGVKNMQLVQQFIKELKD